jgi:hypothetical protein
MIISKVRTSTPRLLKKRTMCWQIGSEIHEA